MQRKSITCAIILALGTMAATQESHAVTCGIGYVNGVAQQVCYDDDPPSTGGGGTGGGGTGGGGTGGGGTGGGGGGPINAGGVWVVVPGYPGVRINVLKKEVETTNLSCGDEEVLRQREMQVVVVRAPLTPVKSAALTYTLKMQTTGESQKFWRATVTGSLQMYPVSECN